MRADLLRRWSWRRAVLAATLVLGACGTPEGAKDSGDGDPADETPTTRGEVGKEIAVTARDYAFEGIPAEIAAGSKLTLKNSSTKEAHELIAFKLAETETRPAADLAKLPEAEFQKALAGEPATVLVALPKKDGIVVEGDGTLTEAGRYIFLCFVPVGADPALYEKSMANPEGGPPDAGSGPQHFTQGMYAEAKVN